MSDLFEDFLAIASSLVNIEIFLLSSSKRFNVNVTNKNIVNKLRYKYRSAALPIPKKSATFLAYVTPIRLKTPRIEPIIRNNLEIML